MIASRTFQRANTIPEMALVISLVLLTLFGVFQYALLGFNQIGADGAAFVGDHAAVAQYGNPTQTNQTYAQQVALGSFPHAQATFTASVPKNDTYELDVSATHKSLGMAQLFPATTSSYSRIVEPSASQVANSGPAVGQCATGATDLTFGATTLLNNAQVALLGNVNTQPIYQTLPLGTGTNAVQLNLGALNSSSSENMLLANVSSNFTNVANTLQSITNKLSVVTALPGGTQAVSGISSALAPLINSTLGGTYVSAGTGGATITSTVPLTAAQFSTQVTATTNAISQVETLNASGILTPVLQTVVNPLLFGTTGPVPIVPTGGLLNPSGGALSTLNAAEGALNTLDNAASKCV